MVFTNKYLVKQQMEQLRQGKNAYAESEEVIRLLERDIAREKLEVFIDKSPSGCWIIPEESSHEVRE
jgi:hypothetical protein